jgi:DNA 3'-phosphatase
MSVMAKKCRLFSSDETIPHQNVAINTSITIGRNRECRITDLKCSRNYCEVFFDGNGIRVTNCKTGTSVTLTNGETICGPGFAYKIVIISDQTNCDDKQLSINVKNEPNASNSSDNNDSQTSDQQIFSYNDMSEVKLIKQMSEMRTNWQTLCLGRAHMCHFLGGGRVSTSIAAFDFDGTLVTPKSGNKFPTNADDWKLLYNSLPNKIEKLCKSGYRFVVVSNQLGISQGRTQLDEIKKRFEGALTAIGCPCLVLISCYDDKYRKPRPGLWELLVNESRDIQIDLNNSFYVGDAAGRKKKLNGKSDHSSADILFAANVNLPFLTPELFERDAKPKTWISIC